MAVMVIMPRQGQSVETCILGHWYKNVGDRVKTGDLLFSYETDKAVFDEEAKADGILMARFFEAGDEVKVLANVAAIGTKGENYEHRAETSITPNDEEEAAKIIEFSVEPSHGAAGRIRISPLARNMAAQLGIDFRYIEGTGPLGRIIARDVYQATQNPELQVVKIAASAELVSENLVPNNLAETKYTGPASGNDFEVKPLSNIRKLIARTMHQSLLNSAQLTHHMSADARQLLAARKKFKLDFEQGNTEQNITINDLVCYAVIRSLKIFPQVNTHFLGDQIKYFNKVHLGLAVDTDRGLMVPALQNADDFSVAGLSSQLRQIASAARNGSINPDLLISGAATFTVSNLGNYGVEMFTPVINLPQSAILGVCAIFPRPKDLGDGVYAFVPMIGLSLTYDHRSLDGGEATRFLAEICSQIENLKF